MGWGGGGGERGFPLATDETEAQRRGNKDSSAAHVTRNNPASFQVSTWTPLSLMVPGKAL